MQRINPAKALSTEQRTAQHGSSPSTVSTPVPNPASATTLAKLWLLGIGAWGRRWTTSMGELPVDDHGRLTVAGRLWATQLAGLAELRKRVLGIPSLDEVAADIGRMQHRFTRLVWHHLDHWKFTRADGRAADRLLRAAYAVAVEKRMEGAPLPQPPVALVEHRKAPRVPARPETVRKHMDALRSQLHLDAGDVAAEGLPALELSPAEQVDELRANCISAGLHPEAMALEVTADTWGAIRAEAVGGVDAPTYSGFPVRVVKLIPGDKSMRLVRA